MQVSFVVPLYNCLALTQAMVASLRATLPERLEYEIILIDDGSTDGTRAWLATLAPPFRVILNEGNGGYAFANNRGAAVARGEFLVLLNNDLILTPHWLEPLLAVHRRHGLRAGLVGNVQLDVATGAIDHTGIVINRKGKPQHERDIPWWSWLPGCDCREVTALTGACLVIRRALWDQLGGFDERYINGSEDVDLAFRVSAAGKVNLVCFRSVILHHVSASPGRQQRNEENSRQLMQRWRDQLILLGSRDWSRHHLATLGATDADAPSRALTRDALLYAYHLRANPTARILAAMEASVASEEARWKQLLG